jgi:GTP-binding protein
MSMVEGVCLVVCATEGPMPQTKFVLKKALDRGLKPIVVINKVDRPSSRVDEVESEIFDLFCNLDASDDRERVGVDDLLECIANVIPPPNVDIDGDVSMLIT